MALVLDGEDNKMLSGVVSNALAFTLGEARCKRNYSESIRGSVFDPGVCLLRLGPCLYLSPSQVRFARI